MKAPFQIFFNSFFIGDIHTPVVRNLKPAEKIQILLKYDKNNECFTRRQMFAYNSILMGSS
jgi:general stress protein 26